MKLANLCFKIHFQDVIYKIKSDLHLCRIYIINTNTVIESQIDLRFHCFYLEITWKIHGTLSYQRSENLVHAIAPNRDRSDMEKCFYCDGFMQPPWLPY